MVQVAERSQNYFTKEDHNLEVVITGGIIETSKNGSDFLQLGFEYEEKEGDTGYNNYLTEKALPYTAQRVQSILTHNAKDEAEQKKLAEELAALPDAEFGQWAVDHLIGKKAYLHISFSDQVNPKNGLPYIEKNIAGYEVSAPKESAVDSLKREGATPVDDETKSKIPF